MHESWIVGKYERWKKVYEVKTFGTIHIILFWKKVYEVKTFGTIHIILFTQSLIVLFLQNSSKGW